MSETTALWRAVDSITQPTEKRVDRTEQADWLEALRTDPDITVCDVRAYRAATIAYGRIPSLWQQAEWALGTGSEAQEGGGSPLRERSPADLDLMETMLTIKETIAWQLQGRNIHGKESVPAQMRQLAAKVAGENQRHIDWWTFRFEQWARLLHTHLNALETGPKPRYIRNAACPLCRTRQVTLELDGERRVVPALVVDFVHGWIRAAHCAACGHAWFRGDDLGQLATELSDQDARIGA